MELLDSSGQTISFDAEIPEIFEDLFYPKRYKIYYGGRGGAKSWGFADALLIKGTQSPLRILCTRELQKSITDSVHKLLSDRIATLGLEEFYEIQNKSIYGLNGTEFLFNGLKHNAREIKSTEGIDICWVEEAENVSDNSWEIVIPTVRKEGSEIWISFNTNQPTDATYKRFVFNAPERSIIRKVSYKDNPFFPDVLEYERQELLKRDPKAYEHIWEGEFDTRYSGTIYAKWIAELQAKGRITDQVQYDPAFPVNTLWDLGRRDSTSIWFYQASATEVLFLEYYENSGEDIKWYCDVIKEKPYRYHAHYVPWDANKKLMEAAGRSFVEQAWKDHDIRLIAIPETTHANRHSGLRKCLPYFWFNKDLCKRGLDGLMSYHYEYNSDLQIFTKDPVHDWSSHPSTAMEILPRVWQGTGLTQKELDSRAVVAKFHRLREEHNLDKVDPYKTKPTMSKKRR